MKKIILLTEMLSYSPNIEFSASESSLISYLFNEGIPACENTIEQIKTLGYLCFDALETKNYVLIQTSSPNSPIVFKKNIN